MQITEFFVLNFPKMTTLPAHNFTQIRTPILRHFLHFYGHLSLHLHPTISKNPALSYLRSTHNLFLFLLAVWLYWTTSKAYDQSVEEVTRGKPLVGLSYNVINLLYWPLNGAIFLYALRYGPRVVALLDGSNVFYEQSFRLTKGQVRGIIFVLVLADSFTFYLIRRSTFQQLLETGTLFTYVKLFVQYVRHCELSVLFRLLQYGRWATWRSLKRMRMMRRSSKFRGEQERVYLAETSTKLRHLVGLNRKLNALLAFPLLAETFLSSLRMFWSLTFHGLNSTRQVMYFLLPAGNILLTDYFSEKITQTLAQKSAEVEERHARMHNLDRDSKNRDKNKLVYWKQVGEMYSNVFHFSLFNLVTIDRQFLVRLLLFIANYALLINQTK